MSARAVARLAILVAVATTLQIAESLIPKPIPWLRLGLANGVALLVVMRAGFAAAVAVTLVRVALGGLLLGTFGGPAFLLSLAGGSAAVVVMTIAWSIARPALSAIGVSVLGSVAHVAAQLATLAFLLGVGAGTFVLAPILLATAVPLGILTGAVILAVHRRLPAW